MCSYLIRQNVKTTRVKQTKQYKFPKINSTGTIPVLDIHIFGKTNLRKT